MSLYQCITNTIINCVAVADVERDIYPFLKGTLSYIDPNRPQFAVIAMKYIYQLFCIVAETKGRSSSPYSFHRLHDPLLLVG